MGLFDGTKFERPVTCERCGKPLAECDCPRDAAGNIKLPRQQPLLIRTESRGKGKTVTLIAGFDPKASNLTELLKSLKSTCAAGGAVADATIEVQGDHREKAATCLKELGYPVKIR